jgi:predicted ABC-type ATPase
MPELFIITGSNGAGKSTVGPKYYLNKYKTNAPSLTVISLHAKAKRIVANRNKGTQRS